MRHLIIQDLRNIVTFYYFFISMLQVIVQKVSARRKRNTADLPDPILGYDKANCEEKSGCYYITAELPNKEKEFEVGDGKMYGNYKNAQLEPDTKYKIYVRGLSYNNVKVGYFCQQIYRQLSLLN